MKTIELKLKRVGCQKVTDSFLEGEMDDVYCIISTGVGGNYRKLQETGLLFSIREGQTLEMDKLLYTLDWTHPYYEFAFWDKDTFYADDKLGSFRLSYDRDSKLCISPLDRTTWDGEKFHFMGDGAKYWVWFSMLTPTGESAEIRVIKPPEGGSSSRSGDRRSIHPR
jgi:hypothetical protein